MIKYSDIIQQSNVFKRIISDIQNNTLGHCYLLLSGDTNAINDFFDLVACAVYCKNNLCLHCEDCERIINGNNVDVKHVSPTNGKNIRVDDIEEIISDVYKIAYDGREKLYFIHNAERMNSESQNKLLKILEEPPKNVHFFLASAIDGAILNTVKSRSRRIYMDNFPSSEIRKALSKIYNATFSADKIELAASCSGGSLERAEKLLDDSLFFDQYKEVLEMYLHVNKSSDVVRYSKSSLFSKELIEETINISELIFRDVLLYGFHNKANVFEEEVKTLAKNYTVTAVSNIVDKLNDARKKIVANCSPINVGENLLYTILEVKFKCQKL